MEQKGFMENVPELTEEQMKKLAKKMEVYIGEMDNKTLEMQLEEDSEHKPSLNDDFAIYHVSQGINDVEYYIQNQDLPGKDIYNVGLSEHNKRLHDQLVYDYETAKMQVDEYQSRGLQIPKWLIRKVADIERRAEEL